MRVAFTIPAKYRSYVEGRLRALREDVDRTELRAQEGPGRTIPAFGLDGAQGTIRVTVEILPVNGGAE